VRERPENLRRPICGGHARTLRETTLPGARTEP
jgi:hypothetical protein